MSWSVRRLELTTPRWLTLRKTGVPASMPAIRTQDSSAASGTGAKARGTARAGVPPYVALPAGVGYGNAHALGNAYKPFTVLILQR